MINGLSFDIEDWFQVENLREACLPDKWDSYELRVEKNTDILLELLEKYNHKATFFILGWIAEKKPNLIKKIASLGHEIASHGYKHEIVYRLTPDDFRRDLMISKKILEDLTGVEVIGYRAPNFSITKDSLWAIDILKELNFKYDSSIFPISFHDRYGFNGIKDNSFFKFDNGLQEFPLTIYKFAGINFPVGGGAYFRFIHYRIFKFMLRQINEKGKEFIFYLHPWELDKEQPRVKVNTACYMRHYINLGKTNDKLISLLKDFRFQPLKNLLKT